MKYAIGFVAAFLHPAMGFHGDVRPEARSAESRLIRHGGEGTHRVEVRKKGFQTYSTTVRVRRGDTVRVNVSLTPGGSLTRGL